MCLKEEGSFERVGINEDIAVLTVRKKSFVQTFFLFDKTD